MNNYKLKLLILSIFSSSFCNIFSAPKINDTFDSWILIESIDDNWCLPASDGVKTKSDKIINLDSSSQNLLDTVKTSKKAPKIIDIIENIDDHWILTESINDNWCLAILDSTESDKINDINTLSTDSQEANQKTCIEFDLNTFNQHIGSLIDYLTSMHETVNLDQWIDNLKSMSHTELIEYLKSMDSKIAIDSESPQHFALMLDELSQDNEDIISQFIEPQVKKLYINVVNSEIKKIINYLKCTEINKDLTQSINFLRSMPRTQLVGRLKSMHGEVLINPLATKVFELALNTFSKEDILEVIHETNSTYNQQIKSRVEQENKYNIEHENKYNKAQIIFNKFQKDICSTSKSFVNTAKSFFSRFF